MSRKRKALAAAALLWALQAGPGRLRADAPRLNVLLVTADDLGLQLGAYGETLIATPNLDALARDGVRFEVAYAADASCSPSRSTIFTGLHSHATGQYGLAVAGFSLHPHLQDRTIPNLLKAAGYRTGIIGKLHVAPESSFAFDFRRTRGDTTRRVREVAQMADAFLGETGETPFFLMVNYSDPHVFREGGGRVEKWHYPPRVDGLPAKPLSPSDVTPFPFQQIDTAAQRVRIAGYYSAVQRLDDGFGMLMDTLAKHDHLGDTLVIFVGDQGPPFARAKTTLYEAGVRVPLLVRWPGVSQAMSSDALASTIDILPTILDAAGVRAPFAMHGKSLRPVVQGRGAPWRQVLVAEFHYHDSSFYYPRRAIRDGRFKLIHNLLAGVAKPGKGIDGDRAYGVSKKSRYDGTPVERAFAAFADPPELELYDLQADPVEFHNLADDEEYGEIRERLSKALLQYRWQTDDPFLAEDFVREMDRRPAGKESR